MSGHAHIDRHPVSAKIRGVTSPVYSLIAFDERVTFCFNASDHCLVCVRMLKYLRVGSRITITQSHTHTMQQTHTHRAVTGRVEAKKLLSRQRQSEYSCKNEGSPCWSVPLYINYPCNPLTPTFANASLHLYPRHMLYTSRFLQPAMFSWSHITEYWCGYWKPQ